MIVEEIKVEAAASVKTVKELRKELKSLRDQLLNTEQGTDEYNKALMEAANIQKDLKDQMMELNNSAQDFGQVVGNVTGVLSGMAGAVTAVTGTLSLFGIENEEAQKKITATMTSLIGLTQGLSRIDSGVKAFNRLTIAIQAATGATSKFSAALLGSGIGLFVAGFLALAKEAVTIFSKATKDMIEANKALSESVQLEKQIEKSVKVIGDVNVGLTKEQQQQLALMDAQGTSAKAILQAEISMYEANLKDLQVEMEKTKQMKAQLVARKAQLEASKSQVASDNPYSDPGLYVSYALKGYDKGIAETEANINKLNDALGVGNQKVKELEGDIAILNARLANLGKTTTVVKKETETTDNDIRSIEKRLQAFEDAKKSELTLLEERYNREKELFEKNGKDITLLTKEYEAERERIIKETEEKERKIRVENAVKTTNEEIKAIEDTAKQQKIEVEFDLKLNSPDDIIAMIDKEKEAINTIFDIEKTAIQDKINALNELLSQLEPDTDEYLETQNNIASATIELQNLTTENFIKNKELENQKDEEVTQLRLKRAQQVTEGMNAIASVMNSVSDAMEAQIEQELKDGKISEEEAERRMESVRGMQIAVTTIQMLTGIATALSGAFTTKSGPWDIALAAIQAAAIAACGIASIVKIKQVKSDGSGGGATSVPTVSMPSVITTTPDFNQSVDGAMTQTAIQDTRVYVLEHDISETQKKVQVTENMAKY